MVLEESQTKIDEVLEHLQTRFNTTEFSLDSEIKIKTILFKVSNLKTILLNVDNDLLNNEFRNDYETFMKNYDIFITSNEINCLDAMIVSCDRMIGNVIRNIDFGIVFDNKKGIKDNIKYLKSELTKQKNIVESEANGLIEEIAQMQNTIDDKTSDLNETITSFSTNLESLKSNYKELNNKYDETTKKIETGIEDFKQKKNDETETYLKEKNNALDNKLAAIENEYKEKFDKMLSDIDIKNEKISKLIGIVGGKAKIGEYKKNADSSRVERIIWQIVTVILFIAAFRTMFIFTSKLSDNNYLNIIKYIISVVLMGAATYTAKQASNSRKDEVYYRKQELELSSIDVYLENMDEPSRIEIKKNLSEKMFGQAQKTYTNKYEDKKNVTSEEIAKIVELVIKNINNNK